MTFKTFALLIAPLLAVSAPAVAATVTVDFDAIAPYALVDGFYASSGIVFSDFSTADGFGATSQPNLAYNFSGLGIVNTTFGFTSLSFTAGFFDSGTISVFSGANGNGTLLGSLSGTLGNPLALAPYSVSFAGVAHSFTVAGAEGQLGFDDIAFGTGAVPEPITWTLMITGFGLTGVAMRRRTAVAA